MSLINRLVGVTAMVCMLATGSMLLAQDAPVQKEKKKIIVNGTITAVDLANSLVTIADKNNTSYTVKVTEKTTTKKDAEPCTLDKCITGDKVRVFAKKNSGGMYTATALLCGSLSKKKK